MGGVLTPPVLNTPVYIYNIYTLLFTTNSSCLSQPIVMVTRSSLSSLTVDQFCFRTSPWEEKLFVFCLSRSVEGFFPSHKLDIIGVTADSSENGWSCSRELGRADSDTKRAAFLQTLGKARPDPAQRAGVCFPVAYLNSWVVASCDVSCSQGSSPGPVGGM